MGITGRIFNIQKFSLHDGPGIRTTVFFKGCPLECRWCSNPESQNRFAHVADAMKDKIYCGKDYSVEEVVKEVLKDKAFYEKSGGGITFSGGEALQQADFCMALADEAHKEGIHVAIETSGLANPTVFREVVKHIDLLLIDYKHHNNEVHKKQTGVTNNLIQENLQYALQIGISVVIRIPVIPGFNARLEDAKDIATYLKEVGATEVHLLPFHQFGEKKYELLGLTYEMTDVKQLHEEDLRDYLQIFLDEGLDCTIN